MNIRYPVHPEHVKTFDTNTLRKQFLVTDIFVPGTVTMTYSHIDRIIIGGVYPNGKSISLQVGKELAAEYFLERREMGIINVGGPGRVSVDGKQYELSFRDGLYIGRGAKEVSFSSDSSKGPPKFYFNSTPSFQNLPSKKITTEDALKIGVGEESTCTKRTIYQYIHPEIVDSSQLLMGLTELYASNVWNTMPPHTHGRRMEVYFYFNLPGDHVVFHFMGEPCETRHVVVRNEQAVISPSWSIHGGAGTTNYTFIWAMAGENQDFTDMDGVSLTEIR
jgi:4-deoxy-L-threo-5-hexosulose-uronate ketol-isomerase